MMYSCTVTRKLSHPDKPNCVRPHSCCSSSSKAALVPLSLSCKLSAARPLRPVSVLSMPCAGSLHCVKSRVCMHGKEPARLLCSAFGFNNLSLRPRAACHDLQEK